MSKMTKQYNFQIVAQQIIEKTTFLSVMAIEKVLGVQGGTRK